MNLNGLRTRITGKLQESIACRISSGLLPNVWLQPVVISLFKAKSKYGPRNYRPVSLTSVCCKTKERVFVSQLVDYLELNVFFFIRKAVWFSQGQVYGRSIVAGYSEVAGLVDDGLIVDMAVLDFSKAYDVVSHVVLLNKLREIGVCSVLLN